MDKDVRSQKQIQNVFAKTKTKCVCKYQSENGGNKVYFSKNKGYNVSHDLGAFWTDIIREVCMQRLSWARTCKGGYILTVGHGG